MYDYLEENTTATNVIGSFAMDKDVDFKDSCKHLMENFSTSYQMDAVSDLFSILKYAPAKEAYKEMLLSDVAESITTDDRYVGMNAPKLEQLFENSALEIISEGAEYGQLQPIVGLSLPILKKVWLKCPLKDILMTEVPDKPIIKVAIERPFLKDKEGEKYYIPEIFYNDDYRAVSAKGRGKKISDKWYPETGKLPIQELNMLEESGGSLAMRDALGYDFAIVSVKVQMDPGTAGDGSDATYEELTGFDIQPDYAANGSFNAEIKYTNTAGEACRDIILGRVDAYSGVVSVASTAGLISQVQFGGHLQNVNNNETLELDVERTLKEWKIPDSTERLNTGLPIEKIKDYKTLFDMDVTTKVISDMGDTLANFEDSQGLQFLDDSYTRWKGKKDLPYGYNEGFVETWNFNCKPNTATTFITTSAWIDTELKYHLNRAIDKLKTKLKREDIMFVLYGNPENITLIQDNVKWIIDEDTKMGGVQVDYRFGVMTANKNRLHVVSTMKVSKDKGIRIVAYPLSKEVITFKHYKYSLNIENVYRNPITPLIPNVMATSRYLTTELFPVQGAFQLLDTDFGLVTD